MRFLADECCPADVIAGLRDAGHDIVTIAEIAPGTPDSTVIAIARTQRRTLITEDTDFGELAVRQAMPVPAVVLVRIANRHRAEKTARMLALIGRAGDRISGHFVVVEIERFRFRPLLQPGNSTARNTEMEQIAMTLKIYGIGRSRAWRNLWLAEEAGAPYELVETAWADGGTRKPEFLKINPNGSVPALVDGPLAMWESLAINLYIAKNHGRALYPSNAADEGRTWQWTLFAATELEKPLATYTSNALAGPPEKHDRAKADEAWGQVKKRLDVLDGALKDRPYLLGGAFTVADLNVSAICYNAWINKADFSAWPALSAWLERCLSRPAAQKIRKLRE